MQRVERSARIGAPPETVFAYLADLGNLAEWQIGVVSAEQTSEGRIGVGATAQVVRVTPYGATARVRGQDQPAIRTGENVRVVARMP